MPKKTKEKDRQFAFDFGELTPAAPRARAVARRSAPPVTIEVLPPAASTVLSVESLQPTVEPRSPAQRETEAFRLYQSQQRYTTNLFIWTVVFALALVAVQFLGAVVPEANPGGFKVVFENKRVFAGLLGWVTLGASLWALYNFHCTRALWRKCGFFFQEIMRPADSAFVLLLIRSATFIGLGCILLIIVIVIGYSLPDMIGVIKIAWQNMMQLPYGSWEPEIKFN